MYQRLKRLKISEVRMKWQRIKLLRDGIDIDYDEWERSSASEYEIWAWGWRVCMM